MGTPDPRSFNEDDDDDDGEAGGGDGGVMDEGTGGEDATALAPDPNIGT